MQTSWQYCHEQRSNVYIHPCYTATNGPNLGIRNKSKANMELTETNKLLELPKITSERLVKQGLKRYDTPYCCFCKLTVPSVDHYNTLSTHVFPMTLSCSGQSVAA